MRRAPIDVQGVEKNEHNPKEGVLIDFSFNCSIVVARETKALTQNLDEDGQISVRRVLIIAIGKRENKGYIHQTSRRSCERTKSENRKPFKSDSSRPRDNYLEL